MEQDKTKLGPKVSIIIPTYNQVDYVEDTINSVLEQSYENLEIIVTDDGSTDGTKEVLKKFNDDKIKIVFSEKNTGIASNMNRGLTKAGGDYVAWLGGDDLMMPEKIKTQVIALENNINAVGCYHDAIVFESETNNTIGHFSVLNNGTRKLKSGSVELWLKPNYKMLPSTVMFRRKYALNLFFDERLKYANDWLFDIELFRNGTCQAINETLVKYRRHSSNVTSSDNLNNLAFEESLMVMAIVQARYPELHSKTRKVIKSIYIKEILRKINFGDNKKAFQVAINAIRERAEIRVFLIFILLPLINRKKQQYSVSKKYYQPTWLKRFITQIFKI